MEEIRRRETGRRQTRRRSGFPSGLLAVLLVAGIGLGAGWLLMAGRSLWLQGPGSPGNASGGTSGFLSSGETDAQAKEDLERSLRQLADEVPEARPLVEHPEDYPQCLLRDAVLNRETLEFVLGWPEHQNDTPVDTVEEAEKGKMKLLLQWDPRWGYGTYGDGPIGATGCGPTCLTMVIHFLTGDSSVTPYTVSQMAEKAGYYVAGTGSSWDLMARGGEPYGLTAEVLPLDRGVMEKALNQGKPIILSVGPGDFTTTGHFIVVGGVENGAFRVYDPNRTSTSGQLWEYEKLSGQIRNLWAYSVTQGEEETGAKQGK